jgi:ABC-2 type transport system ATP-binding protein
MKVCNGEIHGLLGSNGAGKTTTLKILTGLAKPSSGIVRVNGFNVETQQEKVKNFIGYLPENPILYRELKVKEVLYFIGLIYSIPENILQERINKYVSIFDISELLNEYVGFLSRGELQRVTICSIMIKEPLIFLLDEPFFSLDPKNVLILIEQLKEKSKFGSTILLTTNLLNLAKKVCDNFTIIEKGKTAYNGSLIDLKNNLTKYSSLYDIYINFTNKGQ